MEKVKKLGAVLIVLFLITSCFAVGLAIADKGPGAEDKPGPGPCHEEEKAELTALEDFRLEPKGEKQTSPTVTSEGIIQQVPDELPEDLGLYQLTNVSGGCMHPMFSPDGTKIAYMNDTDNDDSYNRSIWVMELAFASPPAVVNNYPVTDPDEQCAHLEGWSPDGTKILFRSPNPEYDGSTNDYNRLWIANADGSGVNPLKAGVGNQSCFGGKAAYAASYSPDGTKIVYTLGYYRDPTTLDWDKNIYVMNADGGNARQLTNRTDLCLNAPRWSPDGRKILYKYCSELWTMDADGENQEFLVDSEDANFFAWSPDGEWIIYETPNGDSDIYKVRPDGSGKTRLTPSDEYCEHTPLWGPDGRILYRSDELSVEGITDMSSTWVMNPDGSQQRMLNPWGGKWHDWNPTGEWVVFQTCEPPTTASDQIFIMNTRYAYKAPALMPIGLIALAALLSVLAAISIIRKREDN